MDGAIKHLRFMFPLALSFLLALGVKTIPGMAGIGNLSEEMEPPGHYNSLPSMALKRVANYLLTKKGVRKELHVWSRDLYNGLCFCEVDKTSLWL